MSRRLDALELAQVGRIFTEVASSWVEIDFDEFDTPHFVGVEPEHRRWAAEELVTELEAAGFQIVPAGRS